MSVENSILDFGTIDFTPDWAKKSAGVSVSKGAEKYRDEDDGPAGRPPRGGGREGGGERKSYGERRGGFGDRKDRKPFGGERKGGFGDDRRGGKSFGGERKGGFGGERKGGKPFGERKPFRPAERPLEIEVRILPETKALGTIMRKITQDFHAYKLKELAHFFLDNPESVLVKVTAKKPQEGEAAGSGAAEPPIRFFQCKACGFASTRDEDVIEHILTAHLGDYYDSKEIETEPPKGNFNCVAKCGLSGVLLGPPNIHEFNAVVREMIRTRYPDMSEEQYRAHIEMVREPEAIEEWRKGATKKTVFFAKGQAEVEGAAQLTREQAEGEFRRTILANLLDQPKHLMITAEMALKSPVRPLVWAVRDELEKERRSPHAMCIALRGAFHHRKLHFFRANDAHGPEFVCSIEHRALDTAHAIPELANMAKFVEEHPCCDRSELAPGAETEKTLACLASSGFVVAFTNGVYSISEKFPKYGPQWKKRGRKEEPKAVDAPVAEEPVVGRSAPDRREDTPVPEAPVEAPVVEEKKEEVKQDEIAPVVAE